jgi:hypothetical protein
VGEAHARSLDHAIAAACIHGVCGFRRIALAAASAPCRARYGIPDARPRPGRPRPSSGPSSSRPHSARPGCIGRATQHSNERGGQNQKGILEP